MVGHNSDDDGPSVHRNGRSFQFACRSKVGPRGEETGGNWRSNSVWSIDCSFCDIRCFCMVDSWCRFLPVTSFWSLSHTLLVVSVSSFVPFIIHPFGSSDNYLSLPYMHRVLAAAHQNHRVIQSCIIHCLQCLVVWFRPEILFRPCIIIVRRFISSSVPLTKVWPSAPLLSNLLPHFQTLINFLINTLPKPVLIALLYRLFILHMASRILPTIGADDWSPEDSDNPWEDRPVSVHFEPPRN